jgi:hypothetical protein
MFGAKKLGENLAGALESRAKLLEAGKVKIVPEESGNRLIAATLKMVADAIRQVAVDD